VDRETIASEDSSVAAARALEQFDAYSFLVDRGTAVVIGPSGNNLRDLRILIAGPPQP
jgi:glycerate 2-kinase